jgi:hypothetical protein
MATSKMLEADNGLPDIPDSEIEMDFNFPRKSNRKTKPNPVHADYFKDLRRERLKNDLKKSAAVVEGILENIQGCDVMTNPVEVQLQFDRLELEWQTYQMIYGELATIITDTTELQVIGSRRQELHRRIGDQRQKLINTIHESADTFLGDGLLPVIPNVHAKPKGSRSSAASSIKSSASKLSSTSSKARATARSAELAKLKLQQAVRKSELKQRQIKEQAKLEKTRVELEAKKAETELQEHLQDLKDEVECAQYEAELLAEEVRETDDRNSDTGQQQTGSTKKAEVSRNREIAPLSNDILTSTPNGELQL